MNNDKRMVALLSHVPQGTLCTSPYMTARERVENVIARRDLLEKIHPGWHALVEQHAQVNEPVAVAA